MIAITKPWIVALLLLMLPTSTAAWPRSRRLKDNRKNNISSTISVEEYDQGQCFVELEFSPYYHTGRNASPENEEEQKRHIFSALSYVFFSLLGVAASAISVRLVYRRGPTKSAIGSDICFDDDDSLGGLDDTDVVFDGIKLTLNQKVKKNKDGTQTSPTRYLLNGSFRGRAYAGRMMAIMGPSGAGKSVFLHALAGRIKQDKKLKLSGDRFVNDRLQAPEAILPAAFIEQEVNFFPRMTVQETMDFRIALHYGDLMNQESRDKLAHNLIDQVGLLKSADTIVGDSSIRGISAGERKRLSIAVEMISAPDLVFCDEPTSSLDSAAATVVIEKLRALADGGKTVICVIHQPSSNIFGLFDDLLLISEGRQMYCGPAADAKAYMEDNGYHANKHAGTAEHILECISTYPRFGETSAQASRRLRHLAELAAEDAADMDLGIDHTDLASQTILGGCINDGNEGPRTSMWTQFQLLLHRALAETFRGKDVIMIKTLQQVVVACIYGGIYSLGKNQASILDRFGLLSLISIGGTNMAIATTLRAFPKEKNIASAEIAIKQYNALPYFVAKAISEFPLVFYYNAVQGLILFFATGMNPGSFWPFLFLLTLHALSSEASGMAVGAVSPSSDVALAIFPAILILFVIFDGRNISYENTPYLLRWISKISLIRWGFEGLVVNEFGGLEFEVDDASGPVARTGEEALALFGLEDASIAKVIKAELSIMVICWILAFIGLSFTKQKFVRMEAKKKT